MSSGWKCLLWLIVAIAWAVMADGNGWYALVGNLYAFLAGWEFGDWLRGK